MVVQHNMQAANANRMLNVTTSAQSKSTEKLSSGYKINRAADDAAGRTISEKMRKQIKGCLLYTSLLSKKMVIKLYSIGIPATLNIALPSLLIDRKSVV